MPVLSVAGPDGDVSYVSEGTKTPLTFTLTLTGQRTADVTVDYATGQAQVLSGLAARQGFTSATAGDDFTAAMGTVTFSPSDTTREVTVQLIDDDVSEGTEFFGFKISNVQNAQLPNGAAEVTVDVGILDDDPRGVTISPTSMSLDEPDSGETAVASSYTVKLDSQPTDTVTVTIGGVDPAATVSGDTLINTNTLTFTTSNWGTAQTVALTPVDDANGTSETIMLTHTISGGDYSGIMADSVTVNVADNDARGVVLSPASLTLTEDDDAGLSYTVKLATQPSDSVTVTIGGHAGASLSIAGNTLTNNRLTFTTSDWDTEQTVKVVAVHDDNADDESEMLRHTASGGDYANVSRDLPVTVEDDAPETLIVAFQYPRGRAVEGSSAGVRVTLDADPERMVTIPVTRAHLNGASGNDYSGLTSSVTFYSGDTYGFVRLYARQDRNNDDGEQVVIGFGPTLPAGVSVGTPGTFTVTIRDGETTVELAQVGVGVGANLRDDEDTPNVRNVSWQWQRSATEVGPYSDIPAAEGGRSNPYIPSAGDLGMWLKAKATFDDDFGTGKTTAQTTLLPVLSQPVLSNAGQSHYNVLGYIWGPPVTTHRYAQGFITGPNTSGYRLTEVRLAIFFVDGDSVGGTWAVHADDAGKPAAQPLSAALPFTSADLNDVQDGGDDVRMIAEFTHPDGVPLDPDTKYWIVISQTTPSDEGHIGIGALGEWNGTLTPVEVSGGEEERASTCRRLVSIDPSVFEDFQCTVPVDTGSEDGWSLDHPALAYYWDNPDRTNDDNPNPALLPWQRFDRAMQLAPNFVLRIALVAKAVYPEVTVQFGQAEYTVAESDDALTTSVTENEVAVTVTLSADPEREVEIPITTVDLGGASADDYSGVPDVLTFGAAEREKTITFTAIHDTVDDDDESVRLSFGSPLPAGMTAGATAEATVTITDDDVPAVTVSFGAAAYTVVEGSSRTVTVSLDADPERTVVIPLDTENEGGASDSDYSGVPENVTFASGETEKTFDISATEDNLNESGEKVKLTFGTLPSDATADTPDEATVSIHDKTQGQDLPTPPTVHFENSSYSVDEGDSVSIKVILSKAPGSEVTIPIGTTNLGGAVTGDDYTAPTSVTFGAADTEKTITLVTTEDTEDDDGESVRLSFGTLPGGITATTDKADEATVTITDDDLPAALTVSFGQAAYTVAESDDATRWTSRRTKSR